VGLYWWFDRAPEPKPADAPPSRPSWKSELKTLFGRDAYLFALFLAALAGPWPLAVALLLMTAVSSVFMVLLVIHVAVVRARW